MRFGSLFSGIGGFDLGFEQAGMECVWQCEIDKSAKSVLAKHWPGVPCIEDVRDVRRDTVAAVDLICGGFPCQDLSVAGKRAGLAGERSGLWFEFHRVLADLRPQWVVVENVPGLLSSHRGADFAIVLRGLVELRYGVSWRILDAQYFGVAQRRRRVFIVGSLGDGRSAEVLFEREGLFGHPPTRRAQGESLTPSVANGINNSGLRGRQPGSAASFVAQPLGGHHGRQDLDHDTYVTFDWQAGVSTNDRTEIIDKPGRTRSLTANRTLAVFGGNNASGQIAVSTAINAAPTRRYDFESETFVVNANSTPEISQDLAMPLRSNDGSGNRQAIIFEPRYARNGRGAPDTIAPPIKAQNGGTGKGDGAPVVAQPLRSNVYNNSDPGLDASMQVYSTSGVRRLTPTECERLQGFPDGWTAYFTEHGQCVIMGAWLNHFVRLPDVIDRSLTEKTASVLCTTSGSKNTEVRIYRAEMTPPLPDAKSVTGWLGPMDVVDYAPDTINHGSATAILCNQKGISLKEPPIPHGEDGITVLRLNLLLDGPYSEERLSTISTWTQGITPLLISTYAKTQPSMAEYTLHWNAQPQNLSGGDLWCLRVANIGHCSDSARYRQLGNAVAVPVARWIGKKLMEVLP